MRQGKEILFFDELLHGPLIYYYHHIRHVPLFDIGQNMLIYRDIRFFQKSPTYIFLSSLQIMARVPYLRKEKESYCCTRNIQILESYRGVCGDTRLCRPLNKTVHLHLLTFICIFCSQQSLLVHFFLFVKTYVSYQAKFNTM